MQLFPATMWSAISQMRDGEAGAALEALGRLARCYWRPLYAFVRHRGLTHEDAADAVQGFFSYLITRDLLRSVERRETRFRTFLLRCFTNWLISSKRRDEAQRRGGSAVFIPWVELDEEKDGPEPAEGDAERMFDRRWAQTVFEHARTRLDEDLAGRERPDYHREICRRIFHPPAGGPGWAELADRFGTREGAVRKAASDMRGRFASLLREEVSVVVSGESEVDEELSYLFRLLSESQTSR